MPSNINSKPTKTRRRSALLPKLLFGAMLGLSLFVIMANLNYRDSSLLIDSSSLLASFEQSSSFYSNASLFDLLSSPSAGVELNYRKYTETAVICSVAKYEENYIDEWADYHLALGFAKLYIYDNSPDFDLQQWALLRKQRGHPIHIEHFPVKNTPHIKAVQKCHKRALKEKHTWGAFIALDEFLVLKQHNHVVPFLQEYCAHGSVLVHWIIMGKADREVYQPQPVTKRFRYREPQYPNRHIKGISRLSDIKLINHAHFQRLKEGFARRTTSGQIYAGADNKKIKPGENTDVALLYHYGFKSHKEYLNKRLRGRAGEANEREQYNKLIRHALRRGGPRGDVRDDTVWNALKRLVPAYQVYDVLFPENDHAFPPKVKFDKYDEQTWKLQMMLDFAPGTPKKNQTAVKK